MGYRNGVMASDELISHTNVAGNLIKPMLCASKPLKHQKVRRFLMFSTGTHFSTRHATAHARADTHASKFTCAIYCTHEIIVFSLLVLLLLYISRKKLFIKGFFIED